MKSIKTGNYLFTILFLLVLATFGYYRGERMTDKLDPQTGVVFACISTIICLGIGRMHLHAAHRSRFINYHKSLIHEINVCNEKIRENQNKQDHNNPSDTQLQTVINNLITARNKLINDLNIAFILNSLPPDDDDTKSQLSILQMNSTLNGEEKKKRGYNILNATIKNYKIWVWIDYIFIASLVLLEFVVAGEGVERVIYLKDRPALQEALYWLPGILALMGGFMVSPILEEHIYPESVGLPDKTTEVEYNLNVTAQNGNVVKSPNKSNYITGTFVQLTAIAASGYRFVNWGGDIQGEQNPYIILVDENKNITANFASSD
jgi:hypothetical protein